MTSKKGFEKKEEREKLGRLYIKTLEGDYETLGFVYKGKFPGRHNVSLVRLSNESWHKCVGLKFSDGSVVDVATGFVTLQWAPDEE
jgi:hypothetical protein